VNGAVLFAGLVFCENDTFNQGSREDAMTRTLISATAVALLSAWAQPATAQDLASQIVGVWKYTSQGEKEIATGKTTRPFGEKPTGHLIYTKGGHIAFVLAGDNRKAPATANFTDADRVNLFNTIAAASGTYKVEGNTLVVTYEASWNQTWTGTTQKRQAEIAGSKLTLTSAPYKNQEGQDSVFVVTLERVE
jgi:hypothetical protein